MSDPLPYQNPQLSVAERVEDLISRMTIEEKAGQLFHDMASPGAPDDLDRTSPEYGLPAISEQITNRHMTHFNILGTPNSAGDLARWHNAVQELAASTRLGIPVTVSTDPRHAFSDSPGASLLAGPFSQWPEIPGLAALRDPQTVRRFADIARREYLAVGIRSALHPQIDLATEPRWGRISGTFGEDPELTSELARAYIEGFQGPEFGTASVATVTKHFPGGGPQKDGTEPHFAHGKEQVYPGGQFETHLAPFREAIARGTRQIMPSYGIPMGLQYEEVAFAFNRQIITDLLRTELGFAGIIVTDWGLVTDVDFMGEPFPARAWGVEHLTELERVVRIIDAGCDQFGGESRTELVLEAVSAGLVSEDRLDESLRRILAEKFELGLFDSRYVDPDAADEIVGSPEFRSEGLAAQQRSITVLTNTALTKSETAGAADAVTVTAAALIPIARGVRVYAEGIEDSILAEYGTPVASPAEAEVAILRIQTPFDSGKKGFEGFFRGGDLRFPREELDRLRSICEAVPTAIDVYLERPAILTEIATTAGALVANYGATPRALLDVLFGEAEAQGRLPFDLPSSWEAVLNHPTDTPFSTQDPLFRFGDGLDL